MLQKKIAGNVVGDYDVTEKQLNDLVEASVEKVAANYDPYQEKTMDEFEELEDDLDEEFFSDYRAKRIAELQATARLNKYGAVREIRANEWSSEVTKDSQKVTVIVHLYAQVKGCALMNSCMRHCAAVDKTVKFLTIKAADAIKGFPDKNCPCLIVYKDGDMAHQALGLEPYLGQKTRPTDVEWYLKEKGYIKSALLTNPKGTEKDRFFIRVKRREDNSVFDDQI